MFLFLVSLHAGKGLMMGMVAQVCNLSMWEAAADKLPCVSCQLELDSETLPQIPNKKKKRRGKD